MQLITHTHTLYTYKSIVNTAVQSGIHIARSGKYRKLYIAGWLAQAKSERPIQPENFVFHFLFMVEIEIDRSHGW